MSFDCFWLCCLVFGCWLFRGFKVAFVFGFGLGESVQRLSQDCCLGFIVMLVLVAWFSQGDALFRLLCSLPFFTVYLGGRGGTARARKIQNSRQYRKLISNVVKKHGNMHWAVSIYNVLCSALCVLLKLFASVHFWLAPNVLSRFNTLLPVEVAAAYHGRTGLRALLSSLSPKEPSSSLTMTWHTRMQHSWHTANPSLGPASESCQFMNNSANLHDNI